MACCLRAPSHYLNQCWLIISQVFWHKSNNNFTGDAHDIYPWYQFENYLFKIRAACSRGQWVKKPICSRGDGYPYAVGPDLPNMEIHKQLHFAIQVINFDSDRGHPKNHTQGSWFVVFKSSPPSAAYMCWWTWSSLLQKMACCLFGAKPFSKPMLGYCQLEPQEQISVTF